MELLLLQFTIGMFLGFIYFGGLWVTVRHLGTIRNPGLAVMSSFVLRASVIVFASYLAACVQGWDYLLSFVVGFLISRGILMHYLSLHE